MLKDFWTITYIHIDDVGAKEQKQHRDKKNPVEASTVQQEEAASKEAIVNQKSVTKDKRPTVQNTVARIEQSGNSFTFTGRSVAEILRYVLAFLLNNGNHSPPC